MKPEWPGRPIRRGWKWTTWARYGPSTRASPTNSDGKASRSWAVRSSRWCPSASATRTIWALRDLSSSGRPNIVGQPVRLPVMTAAGETVMTETCIQAERHAGRLAIWRSACASRARRRGALRVWHLWRCSHRSEHPRPSPNEQVANLQATLGRMEHVLGVLSEGIAWTDDEGNIMWCNPAFARLAMRPALAVIGKPVEQILVLTYARRASRISPAPGAKSAVGRQIVGRPNCDRHLSKPSVEASRGSSKSMPPACARHPGLRS